MYLGLPIESTPRLFRDRFCKRFATWKMEYLLLGGRIILIRATNDKPILVYYLSILKTLMGLAKVIEKLQMIFL